MTAFKPCLKQSFIEIPKSWRHQEAEFLAVGLWDQHIPNMSGEVDISNVLQLMLSQMK